MGTVWVTRVLGYPRCVSGEWALSVEVEDFGVLRRGVLHFGTKVEAESITAGYRFIG